MFSLFTHSISFITCEIYEITNQQPFEVGFKLEPENISTGYFCLMDPTKYNNIERESKKPVHTFSISIVGKSGEKKFFETTVDSYEKKHFSFSNAKYEELFVKIQASNSQTNEYNPGYVQMNFSSKFNTFDTESAVKHQIEPAIKALDKLIKKLNDVINISQNASTKTMQLGAEHKKMFGIVVFLSFIGLVAYAIFNAVQVSLMKKYLREKKYL